MRFAMISSKKVLITLAALAGIFCGVATLLIQYNKTVFIGKESYKLRNKPLLYKKKFIFSENQIKANRKDIFVGMAVAFNSDSEFTFFSTSTDSQGLSLNYTPRSVKLKVGSTTSKAFTIIENVKKGKIYTISFELKKNIFRCIVDAEEVIGIGLDADSLSINHISLGNAIHSIRLNWADVNLDFYQYQKLSVEMTVLYLLSIIISLIFIIILLLSNQNLKAYASYIKAFLLYAAFALFLGEFFVPNILRERYHTINYTLYAVLLVLLLAGRNFLLISRSKIVSPRLRRLIIVSRIVLVGFIISSIYHYINREILNLPYPKNTFVFHPDVQFTDLMNNFDNLGSLDFYRNSLVTHFPFALILTYLFTLTSRTEAYLIFFGLSMMFMISYTSLSVKKLTKYSSAIIYYILILCTLSYPLLFSIDRGNVEIILFGFLALFIYFYFIRKKTVLATVFLAMAIAMKVFPAVLGLILLKDKKYKEIIILGLTVIILTLLPFIWIKGGVLENINLFQNHLKIYNAQYIIGTADEAAGLGFNHSLFGVIRLFFSRIYSDSYVELMTVVKGYYTWFSLLVVGLISVTILRREYSVWKIVALLVICFDLLPYISADYKLIHLFLPMVLYFRDANTSRFDNIYSTLFGLLLIPKAYYHFSQVITDSGLADISISVVLNPILLISLMCLILYDSNNDKKTSMI